MYACWIRPSPTTSNAISKCTRRHSPRRWNARNLAPPPGNSGGDAHLVPLAGRRRRVSARRDIDPATLRLPWRLWVHPLPCSHFSIYSIVAWFLCPPLRHLSRRIDEYKTVGCGRRFFWFTWWYWHSRSGWPLPLDLFPLTSLNCKLCLLVWVICGLMLWMRMKQMRK